MVISEKILFSTGGIIGEYNPSEIIFSEGDLPHFYYQIIEGEVKLNNYNEEGKESIQGLLTDGQSIGESLLFTDNLYPFNAVSLSHCKIIKLSKHLFIGLLKQHPEICFDINKFLSQRLYFKHVMAQNISSQNPANKLKTLLDYFKSQQSENKPYSFLVPLTRQQMANFTGLCVETVIRALKKMEQNNLLQIENRKILY
ncbi:Crp/Fnr family transcriptional regulator [Chryseobacterium tongliaoense]|uniref:Crp/Fnr family transcriptional regulator n=1 Tax=Chryseobacterium tongliaoense TaxID=3240933 RepID=UPI003515378D